MKLHTILVATLLLVALHVAAQLPDDALLMGKGQVCTVLQGGQSNFNEYWEGTLKRDNPNLGTFKSTYANMMGAWGLNNRINVMAALPYIANRGTASYILPQRGVQDLSIAAKYLVFTKKMGGEFKFFVTGGLSTPIGDYTPELLPMSIGLHTSNATVMGIANVTVAKHFYATANVGHTWRSNVTLTKDVFLFDGKLYYTDVAPVPNVADVGLRVGYLRPRFQAEMMYQIRKSLSGDDIRYNDMPFLTNRMNMTSIGGMIKVFVTPRLAIGANANTVLTGRNVGKAQHISTSVFYIFGKMPNTVQ
jgi:hypothetical protein